MPDNIIQEEGSIITLIDDDLVSQLQLQFTEGGKFRESQGQMNEIHNHSIESGQMNEINNHSIESSEVNSDFSRSLVGQKNRDLNELFQMYCQHANEIGFSVRKSTQRLVKGTLIIREKHYVCSNEGHRYMSLMKEGKKRKVPETRTNCDAKIIVKLRGDGLYVVVSHILIHNHTLTRMQWQHLHRSGRGITEYKADAISEMCNSGMKTIDQFNLLCSQYGGQNLVGHTRKDHYNFVTKLKMKELQVGDAHNFVNNLCKQQTVEPGFFFRFHMDEDNRLTSIFWRDSMMREDFEIYGDVMVYDTTHRTNEYNLVCSPFVGVNNHWSNVMFGCAFLSNEKIESFVWLFEVFKESMGGKCPTTIFTDQDCAIATAIYMVFPETRHRLCLWHIQKNAVSYFGHLKQNNKFKAEFRHCLMGCYNVEEFEKCWEEMIEMYGLQGNSWFSRLYDLLEKWCTAHNKDFFSAGIISSQRSESTNNAIGFKASKTTSLTEFYRLFTETVDRWRSTEADLEFRCSRATPVPAFLGSDLLKHAAEMYTITLYQDFEREFCTAMSSYAKVIGFASNIMTFEVALNEKYKYSHKVKYNLAEVTFSCTCRNFEETGWLCFHVIRVIHINSIFKIPDMYIKKRWTKMAKADVWDRLNYPNQSELMNKRLTLWRHKMMRKYYYLLLKCEISAQARLVLEDNHERDMEKIEKLMGNMELNNEPEQGIECIQQQQKVLDPKCIKTKGRSARKKGHFEKRKANTLDAPTNHKYPIPERLL